jgi:hypothetical protein
MKENFPLETTKHVIVLLQVSSILQTEEWAMTSNAKTHDTTQSPGFGAYA